MKKETVETTIYVAKDGRTFESEKDCRKYEERKERDDTVKEIEQKLGEIEVFYPVFFPLETYFTNSSDLTRCKVGYKRGGYRYFELRNEDDLDMLAEYLKSKDQTNRVSKEDIKRTAKVKKYPQTVCCGHSVGYGRKIQSIDGQVAVVKDYFKKMGYKAKIELIKESN